MKMDYDVFRRRLRDYHSRAGAMAVAIDHPEAYLEPALRLLDDRSEILRWCAIRILAEIGDEHAVPALTALRESGRHSVEIADALRAITGQDPSAAPAPSAPGAGVPPATAASLSDDTLLAEAIRELPATVSGQTPHFVVSVTLSDGRAKDVFVDYERTDPDGRAIVYIWTACGEADKEKYESALKLNMIIPYGAIGLASVEDTTCFAMVNTYLRETANPREIGFSLMTLAREGNGIERALCR